MLNKVSDFLQEKNIIFNPNKQRVRCLAHIINIAVQKVLKNLNALGLDNENALNEEIETEENLQNIIYKVSYILLFNKKKFLKLN